VPRIQVYVAEDLHAELKARKIKSSELFQDAVRAEINRQKKIEGLERYLAELVEEVGEPTAADEAYASALIDHLTGQVHVREAS
jgi:post-segregation antitoxin (ccd killing protein)